MAMKLGIIGYPLGHSISPAFQQAALDYYGLDARFEVLEVTPDELGRLMSDLRAPDVLGASITVPHKEAVMPFLDRLADSAERFGAVNTVVNRGGVLEGHNTDGTGFLRALKEDGGFDSQGKRALLLGAGGAARAVVWALVDAGVSRLCIANRTVERARRLVADLGHSVELSAISLDEVATQDGWDLIVNCTSLGMRHGPGEGRSPLPSGVISVHTLVYDLVYNPQETLLLRDAKKAGARTLGGLPMLVYQGAEAFQLWAEREAPMPVMFQAAQRALEALASV